MKKLCHGKFSHHSLHRLVQTGKMTVGVSWRSLMMTKMKFFWWTTTRSHDDNKDARRWRSLTTALEAHIDDDEVLRRWRAVVVPCRGQWSRRPTTEIMRHQFTWRQRTWSWRSLGRAQLVQETPWTEPWWLLMCWRFSPIAALMLNPFTIYFALLTEWVNDFGCSKFHKQRHTASSSKAWCQVLYKALGF